MKYVFTIWTLCLALAAAAQPYANDWIDYDKSYWRIQTAEDAIYRISYADLQSAGFPVSTIDPRRIQLFHRGQEIAIYVEGEADAVFDQNDFIEFYGQRNDGTLDKELYNPDFYQPHDLYNIFSDSTACFLTYTLSPADRGRRMSSYKENNTSGLPPAAFARAEQRLINTDQYAPGRRFNARDVTRLTAF
ncbi:MAG: transporter, partial [Cyclobacteriaceae bacterium]